MPRGRPRLIPSSRAGLAVAARRVLESLRRRGQRLRALRPQRDALALRAPGLVTEARLPEGLASRRAAKAEGPSGLPVGRVARATTGRAEGQAAHVRRSRPARGIPRRAWPKRAELSSPLRAPSPQRVRALIATGVSSWLRMPQTVLGGRLVRTEAKAQGRRWPVGMARTPGGPLPVIGPFVWPRVPMGPGVGPERGVSRDEMTLAIDRAKREVKAEMGRELQMDAHR